VKLKYLEHYNEAVKQQVVSLIKTEKLPDFLRQKYPTPHTYKTDKALYTYTLEIKNAYLKKSQPLSKVLYDGKIHVINNALGMHTFASRVQGSKLKSKNEIRVASMFKNVPKELKGDYETIEACLTEIKTYISARFKTGDYLLVQGDYGATFNMVQFAKEIGLVPVYATSKRDVKEVVDGEYVTTIREFKHVRFRKY